MEMYLKYWENGGDFFRANVSATLSLTSFIHSFDKHSLGTYYV